jgi:DNA-binding Lrp family transcriptional regulator
VPYRARSPVWRLGAKHAQTALFKAVPRTCPTSTTNGEPMSQMVACVVLIRAVPGDVPALARRIAGIDGVAEVYSVSGDYDLIAIVRVKEYERIAEIVTEEIAQIQGIERTNTLTAFRVFSKQDLGTAWDMFD